ncbi:CehA/McbA family metallohydrolase [Haloarchaeobius litoreus]|uniref:CehA/McbA family metallohydrolase n=1 Tax=Haloarchaeobius litoreus TaxID=755306 RepID=A0ABD6DFK3_9EURY|nr:PHP domain-containing protein [Haloarchaeobius litoreus]
MGGNTDRIALDLHVHSDASYDGHEPVELVLEHAADIGLDGVVITDHDRIEASRKAAELAQEFGLVGIPGVEVSTEHGHLLAIGVEERPPAGKPFDETVERTRELGGAAVVPHPFQRTRHGVRKRNVTDCDAIETYNSMLFTGYQNRRARRFARARDYAEVGGSDAHHLMNVGRAVTVIDLDDPVDRVSDVAVAQVVDALRTGRTRVHGMRTPVHRSTIQYGVGASRKVTYLVTSRLPYVRPRPRAVAEFMTDN